jgi:beta-xylosidase
MIIRKAKQGIPPVTTLKPRLIGFALRALLAVGAAFAAAAPAPAADAPPPFVPSLTSDFADPFVLPDGDRFLAYSTNPIGGGANVQTAISHDLLHWEILRDPDGKKHDALPTLPAWAKGGWTWAPEVLKTGTGFVLYFTAKDRKTGRQCIGAATSANAAGPFVSASPAPLVCQLELGGSIDPDAFRDSDGKLYLYFKNDGNAVHKPAALYVQPLTPDGLGLTGEPTTLLRSRPLGKSWEQDVIEAPSMVKMGGTYVLFFSGGYFGWPPDAPLSPYAIGYATCSSATGPCTENDQPILFSRSGNAGCISGPGHQAVFQVGARYFLAYHAWSVTPGCRPLDPIRWLYISPLGWRDGKPVIGPTIRVNSQPHQ